MGRAPSDLTVRRSAPGTRFLGAALRYWLLIFPRVRLELRRLRRRAGSIEDPARRRLALDALDKHSNIEGAAAFASFVPGAQRGAALRALVAFQAIYNHTDLLAEQPSVDPVRNARDLHHVLIDALGPCARPPQTARPSETQLAGNRRLAEIVESSRAALAELPSYAVVAPLAREATDRIVAFQSLSIGRSGELEQWAQRADRKGAMLDHGAAAEREVAEPGWAAHSASLAWWEIAAAAGSSLPVHALIAAASSPGLTERDAARICAAYSSSIGALHSLLDSLLDREEDAATGQFSLIGCYGSPEEAGDRLVLLARDAIDAAAALPEPRAHLLLVTAMACSYLDAIAASDPAAAPYDFPAGASIEIEALTERIRAALEPTASPVLLVFKLRRLAGRLHAGISRPAPVGPPVPRARPVSGPTALPQASADPQTQGVNARAA